MMPSGNIQVASASAAVPQMMFCLPQMAPQDDYSKVPGYHTGMEKMLTTSGIPLYKLPKSRLTECIEFICSTIDCTLTADLDQRLLSIIVFQLTGVKPELHISELHANTYLDLYLRLRSAHERMKTYGKFDKEYPEKLVQADRNVLDYVVMRTAVASGFHPDWLQTKSKTLKSQDMKELNKSRQVQLDNMFKQQNHEEAVTHSALADVEGEEEEEEEEKKKKRLRRTLCLEDCSPMKEQEDTVMHSAGPAEVQSPLVPPANRQRRHSGGPAQDGRGTSLPTAQDGRGTPRLNTQSYHEMDLEEPVMHEQHEHRNRGPGVTLSQRVEQQRQRAQLREQQFHQRLQPHQIDGDGTESSEDSPPGGNEPQQGAPVDAAATARRSLPWENKPQQAAPVAAAATTEPSPPGGHEPQQAAPVAAAATPEPALPGGHEPQQAAPVAAAALNDEQQQQPGVCTFCLQALNDGSELEALPCGHVFHCSCLAEFVQVTGKRKEESCPLKCHQSRALMGLREEDLVEQRGEAPVVAVEQVTDSEGEEAAARII